LRARAGLAPLAVFVLAVVLAFKQIRAGVAGRNEAVTKLSEQTARLVVAVRGWPSGKSGY